MKTNNHGGPYCKHKKRQYLCRECGGGGLCEHGKQKKHCLECGTRRFCEHGRSYYNCRVCTPEQWAKRIIGSAKRVARVRGYVSPDVSVETLLHLVKRSKRCVVCDFKLDWSISGRSPHLHHNHSTGEVLGFSHDTCNQAEGMLSKMTKLQLVNFLSTLFPEVFE